MTEKTVGELLSNAVLDQLSDERNIKNSLLQRATSLVTGAGAMITLSLGSIGLFTRDQSFHLPQLAILTIGLALATLLIAVALALKVSGPQGQEAIELSVLRDAGFKRQWAVADIAVAQNLFDIYVGLVENMRNENKQRSRYLIAILSLELGALIFLSISVGVVLVVGG